MGKYKELNEKLISIVEANIDPNFRDLLKSNKEKQLARRAKDFDRAKERFENGYDSEEEFAVEQKKVKKTRQNDILKYLGTFIDVKNCTIESISTEGLKSAKLRKILKEKAPCLLIEARRISDWERVDNQKLYSVYYCYINSENRLEISPKWGQRDTSVGDAISANTFMAELNSGDLGPYVYIATGEEIEKVRQEKGRGAFGYRQDYTIERQTKGAQKRNYVYGLDKSGYDAERLIDDLQKRLAQYKLNKGAYTDEIQQVIDVYEKGLEKYKQSVNNWNPRKNTWRDKPNKDLASKLDMLGSYLNSIDSALESKDGKQVKSSLASAKSYAKDVVKFL